MRFLSALSYLIAIALATSCAFAADIQEILEFETTAHQEPSIPTNEINNPTSDIHHDEKPQTMLSDQEVIEEIPGEEEEQEEQTRFINNIIITGNKNITKEAILNRIPYKRGEPFKADKTSGLIRTLYELGYFRNIEIFGEDVGEDQINLHIVLQEKKKLERVEFVGNNHLNEKEIKKKINFSKIPAVDEEELKKFAEIIRELYLDKGYHFAQVSYQLEPSDDKAIAKFTIDEGPYSVVKRIFFKGNKAINTKRLRLLLFTREDWVLSFMDSAGTYHPDAIDMDRYTIETFYHNNGYLTAKVTDVDVQMDEKTKNFYITFTIEEGDLFTIDQVTAPGNEILTEEQLLRVIPVKPGQLYSQAKIQKSLEMLRNLWGEHGYIFADVEPSIQPDEETKKVNVAFYTDLGNKVRLNRINIVGNQKTRDTIIRRQIILNEGDLLTTQKMEFSKARVELLGYFDKRQGVNWKINRIADDLCDLDLILQEVRTGSATVQAGIGGSGVDFTNPVRSLSVTIGFADTNFAGYGIHYDMNVVLSRGEQSGHLNIMTPWIFNKPISASMALLASNQTYQELHGVRDSVNERRVGGSTGIGYFLNHPRDAHVQFEVGGEHISYLSQPIAALFDPAANAEYQNVLNKRFIAGGLIWFTPVINQDMRNHPIHPSHGYQWLGMMKFGFGHKNHLKQEPCNGIFQCVENFRFLKLEGDVSWYTPLIGEHDLILCLHAHLGYVHQLGNHTIPYRELFHVGGPANVRGYLFGQISPQFQSDNNLPSSIGGRKAFWLNAELICPITQDFGIKAAAFYDGGAGWDTPDASQISPKYLRNNEFNYRHTVGLGLRVLNPFPVQVDWGFKLNRNKKSGEPISEMHITMNHNF